MREIVLQNFMKPKIGLCTEESLYFRNNENARFDYNKSEFELENKGLLSFDTFFNSFSIEKWKKYTKVNRVSLQLKYKGSIKIRLFNSFVIDGNMINRCTNEGNFKSDDYEWVSIDFDDFSDKGINFFDINATTNSIVSDARYVTYSDTSLEEFCIALNMCTYKKEKYILNNLKILGDELINNPESELYRKIKIYITDNAGTLKDSINNEFINIHKQNAFGSTGGFTNGLMRILNDKTDYNIKYAVMMDDDIAFDSELIFRSYRFLQLIKEQFCDAWLGASMLDLENQWLQAEKGGNYEGGKYVSIKQDYDLRDKRLVIQNEIEENESINAWWYVAIPMSVVTDKSLPYPMYFHNDDIEYALRNCKKLITLNGISVWHEGFAHKYIHYYFDARNREIAFSLHKYNEAKTLKSMIRAAKWVAGCLFRYRYYEAELLLQAYNDFLQGPTLLNTDRDRKRFVDISNHNQNRLKPIEDLGRDINYAEYVTNLGWENESKIRNIIRKITFNGWLLPANREIFVSSTRSNFLQKYYRAKTVINYDEKNRSFYLETKSMTRFITILFELLYIESKLLFKYRRITRIYRSSIDECTSRDRWNEIFKDSYRGKK